MKNLIKKALLASSLLPVAASATTYTPISECGAVINQPGHYKLVSDLDCSQTPYTPAVRILNTHDVKLKLKGYDIRGKYNQAYYGQGTGIYVVGSRDVEIEGSRHSRIFSMGHAIRIMYSEDVKVDGDGLRLDKNNQGVLVQGGREVKLKELRFQLNKQRDVQVIGTTKFEGEELDHVGNTPQGILLSDTHRAKLKKVRLGLRFNHFRGILLQNARDTEIRRANIQKSQVGLWMSGAQTDDTEVKHTEFDDNNCDLQVLFGAEAPDFDNSDSPLVCN